MNTFFRRLIGAAAFDASVYEEVEADPNATTQALVVVLLSSLAAGLGAEEPSANTAAGVLFFAAVALVGWVAWALVTYEIGVRLLPEPQTRSDPGELLRTIGFATAPGILRIFALLPGARAPIFALVSVWMLVTMIIAVRQALDYESTGRAIGVCTIGWVLSLVFMLGFGWFFGPSLASAQVINPSLYGRDTFTSYCAPCHGRDGSGNGPIASALKTRPADLTKLAARNNGAFPRKAVEEFVTNGRAVEAHGTTDMPVWGPTFHALESDDRFADQRIRERITNVVAYIETLQVK